mmetsp:Transcript_6850/g.24356  ORF Transcript_6850/g.24356 Transcript_6850/m.24356 type:complete len:487 (-) Transcript_6850:1418-2878(-)
MPAVATNTPSSGSVASTTRHAPPSAWYSARIGPGDASSSSVSVIEATRPLRPPSGVSSNPGRRWGGVWSTCHSYQLLSWRLPARSSARANTPYWPSTRSSMPRCTPPTPGPTGVHVIRSATAAAAHADAPPPPSEPSPTRTAISISHAPRSSVHENSNVAVAADVNTVPVAHAPAASQPGATTRGIATTGGTRSSTHVSVVALTLPAASVAVSVRVYSPSPAGGAAGPSMATETARKPAPSAAATSASGVAGTATPSCVNDASIVTAATSRARPTTSSRCVSVKAETSVSMATKGGCLSTTTADVVTASPQLPAASCGVRVRAYEPSASAPSTNDSVVGSPSLASDHSAVIVAASTAPASSSKGVNTADTCTRAPASDSVTPTAMPSVFTKAAGGADSTSVGGVVSTSQVAVARDGATLPAISVAPASAEIAPSAPPSARASVSQPSSSRMPAVQPAAPPLTMAASSVAPTSVANCTRSVVELTGP